MTDTTHDEAAVLIKEKIGDRPISWSDLLALLGWTRGRLQHHVDLMEGEDIIFTKRIIRGNRWIKMISLTPFEGDEDEEQHDVIGNDGNVELQETQGKIITQLLDFTAFNIKEYLKNYIGDAIPEEFMSEMKVGKVILEEIVKMIGFTGLDDPMLEAVLKGE